MKRYLFAIFLGLLAGLLRLAFFESFPTPFSHIDPALLLVVMYIAAPAGDKAIVAGLAAGATMDAMSALPFGAHAAAYAAGVGVAYLLFNGVFTSHDWPGILMISAAGYLMVSIVLATARAISAIIEGDAFWRNFTGGSSFLGATAAVSTQLAVTIALLIIASRIKSRREAWRP